MRHAAARRRRRALLGAGDVGHRHVEQARGEQRPRQHECSDRGREAGELRSARAAGGLAPDFRRSRLGVDAPVAIQRVASATGRSTNSDVIRLPRPGARRRARMLTGTIARSPAAGGSRRARRSSSRSPPVHDASTTSLTVPPRARLTALTSSSGTSQTAKPAVLAERGVDARMRRGDELVAHEQLDEAARPRARVGRAARMARQADARLGRRQRGRRRAPQLGARACWTGCGGSGARRRRRRAVEQHRADVDRADAVDHAVVGLGHERPAPAGEALEQDDAPQRAARSRRCDQKSAAHASSSRSPPGAGSAARVT